MTPLNLAAAQVGLPSQVLLRLHDRGVLRADSPGGRGWVVDVRDLPPLDEIIGMVEEDFVTAIQRTRTMIANAQEALAELDDDLVAAASVSGQDDLRHAARTFGYDGDPLGRTLRDLAMNISVRAAHQDLLELRAIQQRRLTAPAPPPKRRRWLSQGP